MLLTTALLLLTFPAMLKPLRCRWYALHLLLALGMSASLEQHYAFRAFQATTLLYGAIIHLLSITLVTFLLYGWDKYAARQNSRRVPERCLHGFAFAGGTLGALAGSRLFRHKTIKSSFRRTLWLITLLQLLILLLFYFLA